MKLSISQISVAICLYCSMTVAPVDGASIRGLQKRQQETVRGLQDVANPKAAPKSKQEPLEKKPSVDKEDKKPVKPSVDKKPVKTAIP